MNTKEAMKERISAAVTDFYQRAGQSKPDRRRRNPKKPAKSWKDRRNWL